MANSQMENLRQVLAAVAALTLLLSAVSGVNANYFTGYSAFADEGESADEETQLVSATFGASTKVELELGGYDSNTGSVMTELEVQTEGGDLADADYAVNFTCVTPAVAQTFETMLTVHDGAGGFEAEISLLNGTAYADCSVGIGDNLVPLPPFTVNVGVGYAEEDEKEREDKATRHDDEDDEEEDDDDQNGKEEHERGSGVEADDEGADVEGKVSGLVLANGVYDAVFTCEDPAVEMTIEDSLEVEDGEGKFEAEIALASGNYTKCTLASGDIVLASFESFTVGEEYDEADVEEKRKEKRRNIVSETDAEEVHKRRMNANPASTGDYEPGWNYTLVANGTATHKVHDDAEDEGAESAGNVTDTTDNSTGATVEVVHDAEVDVAIDMAVWKSNKALILFDVLGGTVEVEGQTYTVELGYAIYSVSHDAMRIGAFVSDESGNILKLKLRGSAADAEAHFATAEGESIDLVFEGNSGPARNNLNGDWDLKLKGTLSAE